MKITWIGHSCFKIEMEGYTVITDPYEDGSVPGYTPVRETADLVLCSHGHGDHNAVSCVKVISGKPCPLKITKIPTWHDEVKGRKRGPNTIHILDSGKERIAHMGDLGCELEEDQKKQLKNLDVMLIPVGGFFTIDAKQAEKLVREVNPGIVIPMHFSDPGLGTGYPVISTVQAFAKDMNGVFAGCSVLNTEEEQPSRVMILTPENHV